METRASYVIVGSFVMVCLLGLTVGLIWLTGAQFRQEFTYYQTFFNGGVTGLGRGTIVRYNGIEVGNINQLEFDPNNPRRVIVTMQTIPTLRLRDDSVATIEQQGLAGGTYVEIDGGTSDAEFLTTQPGQRYPVIPSRPSSLPQLLQRFNTVGERVSDLLNDDNRVAFTEIMKSLRETTAVINMHNEELGATLANLKVASASMTRTLGSADTMIKSTDTAMKSANEAIGTLKTTLTTAEVTAKKFGKLSDDADQVINSQVSQLMQQARTLITSLNRLSNDLERDPSKLIYGSDQRRGYAPK